MYSTTNTTINRGNFIDEWTDTEFGAALERTYAAGTKTAMFYTIDMYSSQIRGRLNRSDAPKLLDDRYFLEARVIIFPPHQYLFEVFDRKLQLYIEADLIGYHAKKIYEMNNQKKFEVFRKPFAVLTLPQLEAGFVVCLVPLFLSILVFALEWVPALKDLIIFLFIFKVFFCMKKLEQTKHCELMKIKFEKWQALFREKEKIRAETVQVYKSCCFEHGPQFGI